METKKFKVMEWLRRIRDEHSKTIRDASWEEIQEETRIALARVRGTTMNELIFVVEEDPEGGFTARALGESIFTEADSLDELHTQVRDAVRCHFDEGKEPKVIRLC